MSKEELLKYLIAEIDLMMHDKDYRFENEDGTWYSRESCRNLTNEEVFEEIKGELMQLSDLEAKLAESEKRYAELFCRNTELETLYSQKTALLNFYKDTGLFKENKELKQQLAESEKERQHLKDWLDDVLLTSIDHESYYAMRDEYEKEINELKETKSQELADYLHTSIPKYIANEKVELLKKVKGWFINNSVHDCNNNAVLIDYTIPSVVSLLDNQIKQLKEGK